MKFKHLLLIFGYLTVAVTAHASQPNQDSLDLNLLAAVKYKKPDQVQRLIELGANPKQRLTYNHNACLLHLAAADDQIEIMQLLIQYPELINVQDSNGNTPLHWAALNCWESKTIKTLLEAGANQIILNERNQLPIHLTAFNDCHPANIDKIRQEFLKHSLKLQAALWLARN